MPAQRATELYSHRPAEGAQGREGSGRLASCILATGGSIRRTDCSADVGSTVPSRHVLFKVTAALAGGLVGGSIFPCAERLPV